MLGGKGQVVLFMTAPPLLTQPPLKSTRKNPDTFSSAQHKQKTAMGWEVALGDGFSRSFLLDL